jgi:hypothetical protein
MKPSGIRFDVRVQGGEIIISLADFCAIYVKPSDQAQLILRRRTETDDHDLLALAWQTAKEKARELGWIV